MVPVCKSSERERDRTRSLTFSSWIVSHLKNCQFLFFVIFFFFKFYAVRSGRFWRDSVGGFRPGPAVTWISSTHWATQDPTAGGEISPATTTRQGTRRQQERLQWWWWRRSPRRRPTQSYVGHHLSGFRQCGEFLLKINFLFFSDFYFFDWLIAMNWLIDFCSSCERSIKDGVDIHHAIVPLFY